MLTRLSALLPYRQRYLACEETSVVIGVESFYVWRLQLMELLLLVSLPRRKRSVGVGM